MTKQASDPIGDVLNVTVGQIPTIANADAATCCPTPSASVP